MHQTIQQTTQSNKNKNQVVTEQRKNKVNFAAMMDGQTQAIENSASPTQMMVKEEEAELKQKKAIQKSAPEEEELMQGKLIQRTSEDRGLMQGEMIQRSGVEDEELLQGKLIQKVPEEELQKKEGVENASAEGQSTGTKTQMPENVQAKMENSFAQPFGNVNIHQNDNSATQMGALAYTQGNNVHFAPGQYNPNTQGGQELLGHELTHVVQQRQGRVKPTTQGKGMAVNDSPVLENEADVMGKQAAQGKLANVSKATSTSNQLSELPWSKMLVEKERGGLITFIPAIIELIKDLKKEVVNDWSGNADIEDFMPGEFLLEFALTIVGAAIGGALGSVVGTVVKNIGSEIMQDVTSDVIGKLHDIGYDKLKSIILAPSEDIGADVVNGLNNHVQTGTKDVYSSTMIEMFDSEAFAALDNFTDEQTGLTDEELAILGYSIKKTYEEIKITKQPLLQQLTIGFIKLQDLLYIQNESGITGDLSTLDNSIDLNDFYRQDGQITETDKRAGQILITGPYAGIGDYKSPRPSISAAIVTKVNEATYAHLQGAKIDDLPFSIGFRFWGRVLNHGILESSLCKVWFIKDTFGKIWVDLNESFEIDSNGYDQGRDWLARHYLKTDRELTNDEIRRYAPMGAEKLYNSIKDIKLNSVIDTDLFR